MLMHLLLQKLDEVISTINEAWFFLQEYKITFSKTTRLHTSTPSVVWSKIYNFFVMNMDYKLEPITEKYATNLEQECVYTLLTSKSN